jgi:hypothetical protein
MLPIGRYFGFITKRGQNLKRTESGKSTYSILKGLLHQIIIDRRAILDEYKDSGRGKEF